MLAACSTKDSVSEVPDKDDSDAIVPPASVLPFADVVDLSEYFVDEPVEFSESTPKENLCASILMNLNIQKQTIPFCCPMKNKGNGRSLHLGLCFQNNLYWIYR